MSLKKKIFPIIQCYNPTEIEGEEKEIVVQGV